MTMLARTSAADEAIWTVLVAASSVLFSFVFACATPFAALAAVAATRMRRGAGIATVLLAWAGNQAIGFGLLHYPRTAGSFGWGLAIALAALIAMAAATWTPVRQRIFARSALALCAAFAGYKLALYAASFVLGGGSAAFALPVVARIAAINAAAFAGLLVLHRLCSIAGLRLAERETGPAMVAG